MPDNARFAYIDREVPGEAVLAIVGELPKRWGRMDRISRLAVVETGRALLAAGITRIEEGRPVTTGQGGLIGVTSRGSLATDLAYGASLGAGPEMASPTLFSYTLPNTALAEAASHYGLTGPVYSLFSEDADDDGIVEAERWLADGSGLEFMVAGRLDVHPDPADADRETVQANFSIVR